MKDSKPTGSLTAIVLTWNEEENIRRCLEALEWVPRILVVDSFSSDQTPQIAKSFPNVELTQREFDSFAGQCNHALQLVATEWILSLDADYVVTDALRRALMALADMADSYAAASIASLATKMARAPLTAADERLAVRDFGRLLLDRDRSDAELAVEVRQASLAWSGHGRAQTIVSIDTLLYRGQAALQRAREVRTTLREHWQRGTLGAPEAHDLFDELSDLLDLAVTT